MLTYMQRMRRPLNESYQSVVLPDMQVNGNSLQNCEVKSTEKLHNNLKVYIQKHQIIFPKKLRNH